MGSLSCSLFAFKWMLFAVKNVVSLPLMVGTRFRNYIGHCAMSQRGRPFQPGNTFGRGRPKGSRNKTTRKAQELLDKYYEPITQKTISMAIKGDSVAMRLCMERLIPARRDGYVHLPLPAAKTVADVAASSARVLQGVARGQITPTEGESISRMLDDRRRSLETVEMVGRIEALEQRVPNQDRDGGNP